MPGRPPIPGATRPARCCGRTGRQPRRRPAGTRSTGSCTRRPRCSGRSSSPMPRGRRTSAPPTPSSCPSATPAGRRRTSGTAGPAADGATGGAPRGRWSPGESARPGPVGRRARCSPPDLRHPAGTGVGDCTAHGPDAPRAGRDRPDRGDSARPPFGWDTGRAPRSARRAALTAAALAVPVGWVTRAAWGLPTALGAHRRRLRPVVAGSPHFSDGKFHNTLETPALAPANTRDGLLRQWHEERHVGLPGGSDPAGHAGAARRGRRAGRHLVRARQRAARGRRRSACWSTRSGATGCRRPRCSARPGCTRAADAARPTLPPVDAVLISHDHYDHLDLPTVRALLRAQTAPFVVPLGIGEHLRRWGVPDERIVELDWDEQHRPSASLTLTCTEARHFSGRYLHRNTTLWASWAMTGPRHRVFFGGDTGYTPAFAGIGARLGPFDLTAAADRRLQRRLARHPHGPGGGGARARRPRRPACSCRSTGPRSTWPSTAGPSRCSGCWPPPSGPGVAGRRPAARASGSTSSTRRS